MRRARTLLVRGETYLTLETAARCYSLEVSWVRQVYELGLLGEGEPSGGDIAIPAPMLDRLARVVHLARHLGVELELVSLLLEEPPRRRA